MRIWLRRIREQGRCRWLFSSLLALFLLYPHLERSQRGPFLLVSLYTVTCLLAVWVTALSRRRLIVSIVSATPMVVLSWIGLAASDRALLVSGWVSIVLFFLVTTVTMFTHVARTEDVTRDTVYAGISVYLLLGLTWFATYALLVTLDPGSFRGLSADAGNVQASSELLFYSFITLTTVGYGDITPVSSYARSLAVLEAICGVLYVATFVARLVALYRPQGK